MSRAFIQDRIDTVRAYVTHLSTILPHIHRQQSSPASSFLLAPTTKCVFMLLYICVLILRCICADPMRGYTVRTDDTHRRLQGFIWFTTFTSWTHFFKWDSKSPDAGLRGTGGIVQYTTGSRRTKPCKYTARNPQTLDCVAHVAYFSTQHNTGSRS